VVILVLRTILFSKTFKTIYARLVPKVMRPDADASAREHMQHMHPASFMGQMQEHIELHGGMVIFAFKFVRFVGCGVLLGVSIATFILEETGQVEDTVLDIFGKHWGSNRRHNRSGNEASNKAEWLQVALCITTVCVSLYIYRWQTDQMVIPCRYMHPS
jgi:hypothetical protein